MMRLKIMLRLTSILLMVFLLSSAKAQVAKDTYRYVLLGQAIDKHRRPVPHARVIITPGPDNEGGDFVYSAEADAKGHIRFEIHDSNLVKRSRLLYVTGPLPPNTVSPIKPPFDEFPSLVGPAYVGRRILIKKNGAAHVGNIYVPVFYGVVKVFLQDTLGKPLVRDAESWRYVWLRVRNEKGDVVIETSISKDQIEQAVDLSHSSLAIALPEGLWIVEISPKEDQGPWLTSGAPLNIKAHNEQLQLTLKLP